MKLSLSNIMYFLGTLVSDSRQSLAKVVRIRYDKGQFVTQYVSF